MYGYNGKVAVVDLTTRTVQEKPLTSEEARKFIGGSGLGAYYLARHFKEHSGDAAVDPFSPENPLIFTVGPYVDTPVPCSGRHAVTTLSPLTGIFAESDIGGSWGVAFKRAGYDGLIVTGRADSPVYILVAGGRVSIHDAAAYWGKDTFATYEQLKGATGGEVTCIGPAGERLVRYASIMSDGRDARAAGRCGVGAVMGSKNLKAVVARGNKRTDVWDRSGLVAAVKAMIPRIRQGNAGMTRYGTAGGVITHESYGNFPLQNWRLGRWPEGVEKISGQRIEQTIFVGRYYCHGCVIGCGKKIRIKEGRYAGVEGAGPEYETLGCLGGMCLIDDLEAIAYANELCNRYGMDTISAGNTIAFAMEAFEKGLIGEGDTGGVKLTWGNADAMVEMVRQIGERTGLGKLLGEGAKRAAEALGGLAVEFAHHVKGLEFPAHDPRAFNGVALAYATSNRGACHLQAFTHPFERVVKMPELGYEEPHDRLAVEGKGEFVARLQNLMSMVDSLKICKFVFNGGVQVSHLTSWLNSITGWNISPQEFLETGERLFTLKRMFNVRYCGISRKDDTLPPRPLTCKRRGEGVTVNLPPLGRMLSDYYECRGWDEIGIPTREVLERLDIADLF
ncbi:aldehyde ferredoxin oxidoreductase family protein [Thermanaeromonas sp. C210]|uniref:aldehyde ferredoxin oxidoreductase family protein n=1 Tax=Thermanaeromonas sp. C210 TaxID=2731925 RepID=UPI00155D3BA1|nr:aldehyde ferredoxin oxidoreductase family protein [Thermanaeromonas sp. C210]GFN22682.1 aldehyde ferredoxin oxidoreductase [Thermanaeromonas sp. C210]